MGAPPSQQLGEDGLRGGLTERQQEILDLLRAGKGNKDIACQLGIGLGTVKQHVVALFRKLNVSSRAAAISRGYDVEWHAYPATAAILSAPGDDSLIELRPSCVLSVAVCGPHGGPATNAAWQELHRATAALSAERDCTMVALPGSGIDILFGLHRVGETDSLDALTAARILAEAVEPTGAVLRAGLAAGFLVASMHRYGGWTGESVAGRAIARARELRDGAAMGELLCDLASRRLMAFAGRVAATDIDDQHPMAFPLKEHKPLTRRPPVVHPEIKLVDRVAEMAALRQAFEAGAAVRRGALALIMGEAGMGKTTLARAFEVEARLNDWSWVAARCGDGNGLAATLAAIERRTGRPPARPGTKEALAGIKRGLAKGPLVVLLDDLHRAGSAEIALVQDLARLAERAPLGLLATGRKIRDPRLLDLPWHPKLTLGRLPRPDVLALIGLESGGRLAPEEEAAVADLAHGVPLFAIELVQSALAQPAGSRAVRHPPMSLITLVLSRLDGLAVDRSLLRVAARFDGVDEADLAEGWGGDGFADELAKAMQAGVLTRDPASGAIRFAHPLIHAVMRCVMLIERAGTDAWKIRALAE